jgi:hypothetical protein
MLACWFCAFLITLTPNHPAEKVIKNKRTKNIHAPEAAPVSPGIPIASFSNSIVIGNRNNAIVQLSNPNNLFIGTNIFLESTVNQVAIVKL